MTSEQTVSVTRDQHDTTRRSSYVIDGGKPGRDRLRVLSSALAPTTGALLGRAGVSEATAILDLGCGGGDVTLTMARMARGAHVTGVDFDPVIVRLAVDEAARLGVDNVHYEIGNVTELAIEPASYDVVYARFLLSHLARPELMLARIATWIRPGGSLVIEDVDIPGAVCSPASPAFDRANDLMARAMRRRGGDPELGRQLSVLLGRAGFDDVATTVVQPGGLDGDAKQIPLLTLITITDALTELRLATPNEIEQVRAELEAFVERADTYATTARIFQCVARSRRPQRRAATTGRGAGTPSVARFDAPSGPVR